MTKKQIAMNAIGKVQNTDCKIPFKFTTESFWNDIKDEIPLELMGFFLSTEFAEHFFNNNSVITTNSRDWETDTISINIPIPKSLYHLQQMVVAEDPILYLKDYL